MTLLSMRRILHGHLRQVFTLVCVFLLACGSFLLSYLLRFDFEIPEYWLSQFFLALPPVAFIKTGIFWLLRARLRNWRYLSGSTILFVCLYAAACSILVFVMDWLIPGARIPKGVIIIDFLATVSLGVVVGLTVKTLAERFGGSFDSSRKRVQRAVIVGISNASEAYIMETKRTPGCEVE
ncbi:MAG: hypothetical protein FJY85_24830, partial [Deltaproteobacteria bacterium]|nr:hypothetical protein [Deltaproteobacteria bacterium]